MAHRGAGAPPQRGGGGFTNTKPIYHLSEKVVTSKGAELKMVRPIKLRPGEKNRPLVTLDDFTSMDDAYSVNLHIFNLKGTKDNVAVCPRSESDDRACPICGVLNKAPSWYVVLTAIDRSKWSPDKGKNKGVVYTDNRRLVLITQTWMQRMTMNAERSNGWRGANWEVSRSKPVEERKDGQVRANFKDSPRVGDVWFYTNKKFNEEQLRSEFEQAAAKYGLPVEAFVKPFDYDFVLRPKDHKQLMVIANELRQDTSALKDQHTGSGSDFANDDNDDNDEDTAASVGDKPASDTEINY